MLATASAAYGREGCPVPYQNILARDGFAGLVNCLNGGRVKARVVGNIESPPHTYTVLDFRYVTAPTPGGVQHGGQEILVIRDGNHFVGQYTLSPPPLHTISVKGASILIDAPKWRGNAIIFTDNGPPSSAYLDQDTVNLTR